VNEQSLWRWLSDRLPPGDYIRVESPCSPGVPDVNYQIIYSHREPGWPSVRDWPVHGWLELKIGDVGQYPFKAERRGLRASQRDFLRHRLPLGAIVPIVATIGPALAVWRLKVDEIDTFNDLDRDALRKLAVFWLDDRRDLKTLPIKYLI
jgi:hypothetical protein